LRTNDQWRGNMWQAAQNPTTLPNFIVHRSSLSSYVVVYCCKKKMFFVLYFYLVFNFITNWTMK